VLGQAPSNYTVINGWGMLGTGDTNRDIACYTDDLNGKHLVNQYPAAAMFSTSITSQICDSIGDCFGFNMGAVNYGGPCIKTPGYPQANSSMSVHRTRCSASATADIYTSPNNVQYKVCHDVDAYFSPYARFLLPPFLCEESCDKDAGCVGFLNDGQNCDLLKYSDPAFALGFRAYTMLNMEWKDKH